MLIQINNIFHSLHLLTQNINLEIQKYQDLYLDNQNQINKILLNENPEDIYQKLAQLVKITPGFSIPRQFKWLKNSNQPYLVSLKKIENLISQEYGKIYFSGLEKQLQKIESFFTQNFNNPLYNIILTKHFDFENCIFYPVEPDTVLKIILHHQFITSNLKCEIWTN